MNNKRERERSKDLSIKDGKDSTRKKNDYGSNFSNGTFTIISKHHIWVDTIRCHGIHLGENFASLFDKFSEKILILC